MASKRLDILQNQCDTLLNKLRSMEYQVGELQKHIKEIHALLGVTAGFVVNGSECDITPNEQVRQSRFFAALLDFLGAEYNKPEIKKRQELAH